MATKKELTPEQQIRGLWDKVQNLKRTVAKAEKPNWRTNGQFRPLEESMAGVLDIKTTNDMPRLLNGLATLIGRQSNVVDAAERLGIKGEYKHLNFSFEEWENDFITRAGQLDLVKKKALLEKSEARLTQILPADMKLKLEAESIAASLAELDEEED